MGEESGSKFHVVVMPFPDAQGHLNPILQFAKRLASKGLKITLLNLLPADEHHRPTLNLDSSIITVHHRRCRPYDGAQPESLESHIHRIKAATLLHLKDLIISHHPIHCVFYDSLMYWVLDVAKGFGVAGAPFFTESCAVNAIFYHLHRGWLEIPVDERAVSALPALPVLRISDLPSLIPIPEQYPVFLRLMIDQFCNEPDWIFINTFDALEPQVLQWMQTHMPLKTVGPTVPSTVKEKHLKEDDDYGISLFKSNRDDSKTMEWLDSKDSGSAIYVSFGSVANLEEQQMEELALVLKATNKPFLWVVRESESSKLPANFLEETKEKKKGMVVNWCPQMQVLAHKSVGCFVTHCGWNSVLEALSLGVPMVAMPQWTDQMTNAKFVEDVWKVGVRVSPKENGMVGREEMESCIRQVMEGERSVEITENAKKWMKLAKEAVNEGGTSDNNIDDFVAQLKERKIV